MAATVTATVDKDAMLDKLETALLALHTAENGYKECYSPEFIKMAFRDAGKALLEAEHLLKAAQ